VQRITKGIALSLALASGVAACGGSNDGPLGDVQALVILQRQARNEMGDIFQYTSYMPGARIIKLSPPTADGVQTTICCDQDAAFSEVDISGYDLSFDATVDENGVSHGQLVFAAKRNSSETYGLFMMSLETGAIEQLPTDAGRDYTSPVFLAGGKIAFTTNEVVEPGAPQHRDEYERGTTLQLGFMNQDGTGEVLGPRNLSHRVFPASRSDGRVMFTQWDHLGGQNAGHLMMTNPDGTGLREVFGKEGTGITNSYLKAVEVSPGRVVAIGTSRDRTVQAGTILDIRLGTPRTLANDETINGISWPKGSVVAEIGQSEANATFRNYTPNVPTDRSPSVNQVGRYYDVYPLNANDYPDILVSWADGPVESGTLGAAGLTADFGVYLFDTKRGTRLPILNSPMWDIFAKPLRPRGAPQPIAAIEPDQYAGSGTLLGSMNVYDTSLAPVLATGSMYGVRVMEGFSSEEGFPEDFGTTEFEGHAELGVAPLADDNSWAAVVPANIPVHVQVVDKFGLARKTEPVWTSGRVGEARVCGGCHEDRTKVTPTQPGLLHAVVQGTGPAQMFQDTPRNSRMSTNYTRDGVMGVPWDAAVQPIFDSACLSCHDSGSTNGWSVLLVDQATGMSVPFSFSLSSAPVNIALGELMITGYSESYISMAGFMMEDLREAGITIMPVRGTYKPGMLPLDYASSETAKRLNPVQQFPTQNTNVRVMMPGDPNIDAVHNNLGLTADQHYILQLAADMGVNWFARENNPHSGTY